MTPPPPNPPTPTEVLLWLQDLDADPAPFAPLLAPDEHARAARFRFPLHRDRYLVARGRLRQILAAYLNTNPASISLKYNDFGKPSLAIPTPLTFNLSHSEHLAAYAVARSRDLGIDIECESRPLAEDRIPEAFFSPAEVAALRSLPAEAQNAAFFRCWTRKEAYVKARAEGLHIPLDSFDVSLLPDQPARFLRNAEGWSLASFRIEPNFAGAIVAHGPQFEIRIADPGRFQITLPETPTPKSDPAPPKSAHPKPLPEPESSQ